MGRKICGQLAKQYYQKTCNNGSPHTEKVNEIKQKTVLLEVRKSNVGTLYLNVSLSYMYCFTGNC